MGATVGLVMIVKNEERTLPRLAESVRGQLDHWTIVDTGSTDQTMAIAPRPVRRRERRDPQDRMARVRTRAERMPCRPVCPIRIGCSFWTRTTPWPGRSTEKR